MFPFDLLTKRAPKRSPADEPPSPIYIMGGQPIRFLSTTAALGAEEAQRKSSQLYRITNYVASAVQSVPWYCEADPDSIASEQAGASKIKAINDLLKSPNDTWTAQQLQYWLTLNLMLYARAHFKVGVSSAGTPNGIYPLAARWVRGILNKRGTVESYEYGTGENTETLPTRRTAERRGSKQSYGGEISFPSLTGLVEYHRSPAAIESIGMPLAICAALMQRALDTASGHPNVKYVITSERTLTKAQKDALAKYLEDAGPGGDNSGHVLLLHNTDVKVHELDNKLGDIHSKIPLDDMTRQIAGVFGVPIALLGLGSADAAKYASNYGESRLSFWQDTLVPSYLTPIAAAMTAAICPPGARISFDLDQVPAMWEGRASLGVKLGQVPFLTTTEKRQILGFRPDSRLPEVMTSPTPQPDTADSNTGAERDAGTETSANGGANGSSSNGVTLQ